MTDTLLTLIKNSFGFDPKISRHHFLVDIPRSGDQPIHISEHLSWDDQSGSSPISTGTIQDGQIRVILQRVKWDAIADVIRAHFNQRLKKQGLSSGSWRAGPNLISREFGKELVLLAWAVEDADPALIPTALINWSGLVPEERWWLYTQTAAATGHGINDRRRGWRKAIRFALTENPVHGSGESILPEFYQRASGPDWNAFSEELAVMPKTDSEHDEKESQ